MKVRIGAREFKSGAEAKKHAHAVIFEYVGSQIMEGCEAWGFVNALWERSPQWEAGVLYFPTIAEMLARVAFAELRPLDRFASLCRIAGRA